MTYASNVNEMLTSKKLCKKENKQMSEKTNCDYYYLDVLLKLRSEEELAVVTKLYFQGSIEHSLNSVFGEIGGQTELEVIKFDADQRRAIIKVPKSHYRKVHVALTLIGSFQEIPCHMHVVKLSKELLDFDLI